MLSSTFFHHAFFQCFLPYYKLDFFVLESRFNVLNIIIWVFTLKLLILDRPCIGHLRRPKIWM